MQAHNIGPLDRKTRIVLGGILIGTNYFFKIYGILGDLMVLTGAVWIWEGLLGYCLLYGIFHLSTKRQ